MHGYLEGWQTHSRRVPDGAQIDFVITVAEVIAYSTNVGPRLARAESFRPISEAVGRFAYSQESILDRKDYLLVTAEDVEVHARGKTLDPYNIV